MAELDTSDIYASLYTRGVVGVSRTVIDLDDEALEAAAIELGTTTKRDTINTALREVTGRNRRVRALVELRMLVAEGAVDTDVLLDKRAYRGGLPLDDHRRAPDGSDER